MDKLDVYYGAFTDYRKSTANNKHCKNPRSRIARTNIENDKIEVIVTECEILDDWIIEIEKGLDFIDKAIKEERQFILSNGEVIPIEKVKHVSKESVEHLAKHSDLITRLPKEGEDIIPEKLFTVERLTDYAVYENRFLYMLLCYLRDFISLRYTKIVQLTTTYRGKIKLKKSIAFGDRKTDVSIQLDEKIVNDSYLWAHNSARDKIRRIDTLLKAVMSYLACPLMERVAKAPMLKPPITETNVLKMNKNFRGAVHLYYYITSYEHDGYTAVESVKEITPFLTNVGDEVAEIVELTSFLAYKHGLGIEKELEDAYKLRLEEEKKEASKRKLEQLQALRKRIEENGDSPEEYMLLLEQRNKELEADSLELVRSKTRIAELKSKIEALNETIESLQEVIALKNQEIAQKEREIEQLNIAHQEEIARINQQHRVEMDNLAKAYENKIIELNKEHENHIKEISARYEEDIANLKTEYDNQIIQLNASLEESVKKSEWLQAQHDALNEERYLLAAKVNALKAQSGLYDGDEDFNSREGFDEIEKQYAYFKKFFKEQWKNTRKSIRRNYLHFDLPKNESIDDSVNVQNTDKEKNQRAEHSETDVFTDSSNDKE